MCINCTLDASDILTARATPMNCRSGTIRSGSRSLRLLARIADFHPAEDGSKPSGSTSAQTRTLQDSVNFGIEQFVPLRLTAGHCTLDAEIVVRIHEGEPTQGLA